MPPSRPTTRGAGQCHRGRPAGHGSSRHRGRPSVRGAPSARDRDLRWASPKLSWTRSSQRSGVPSSPRVWVREYTSLDGGPRVRERMMLLMVDERESPESSTVVDRSEGFGERLLGSLLDRAHRMPPHMIAPLIEQEIALIGGRDVEVLLQDYDQMTLVPLPGERLLMDPPRPIDGSLAGRAFQTDLTIERTQDDGVRLFVPLLDGTDRVGVLVFTLDSVDEHDLRLSRRLAGLVADMLTTKSIRHMTLPGTASTTPSTTMSY